MPELENLDKIRQGLEQIQKHIDEYRQRGGCGHACGTHTVDKWTYHLGDNPKVSLIAEAPGPRTMWLTGVPFYNKDNKDPRGSLKLSQAGCNLNKCLGIRAVYCLGCETARETLWLIASSNLRVQCRLAY
jgi:hypothetical protein